MEMTAIILIVGFFFFLLINVPVSISIGLATMVAMLADWTALRCLQYLFS